VAAATNTHHASLALFGKRRLMLAFAAFCAAGVRTADTASAEYEIKAAYLCKFGHYVEWPSTSTDASQQPLVVGVMASDSVVDEVVLAARGQRVQGRPLLVRRIEMAAEAGDGASIVFIARSHAEWTGQVLAAVADRPVLTVTEAAAKGPESAIIDFVVVNDKVRFDVSLVAANRSGLRISARLLTVARTVMGKAMH
jgi:hypothetical protein